MDLTKFYQDSIKDYQEKIVKIKSNKLYSKRTSYEKENLLWYYKEQKKYFINMLIKLKVIL